MQIRKFKKNSAGFTLIEMLIYIAIIGIVISGFVSYSLSVSGARNKNYSTVTVQANGRTALEIFRQKIHQAEAVIIPNYSATSTLLLLDMPGVSPNITFSVIDGVLLMKEGSLATTTITENNVLISNLLFTNLAGNNERENIGIDFVVNYRMPVTDVRFDYSKSYHTAISTRL